MKKYKPLFISVGLYLLIANVVVIPLTYILNVRWYETVIIATTVTLTMLFVDTLIRTITHVIGKSQQS